jgi:hypothetical protein
VVRFLILFIFSTNLFASDGKVLFLKGIATANSKPLAVESQIQYQDMISVGKDSLLIVRIDQAVLKLKAGTSIKLKKITQKKKNSVTKILLRKGEVFFKGKKKKDHTYEVQTKMATMGVRGTEFFTTSSGPAGKEKIWMCVNEGSVVVKLKSNPKKLIVNKGEGIFVNSNKLPQKKQYEWTKKLNWNMGSQSSIRYEDVKDEVNIEEIAYPIEEFIYD